MIPLSKVLYLEWRQWMDISRNRKNKGVQFKPCKWLWVKARGSTRERYRGTELVRDIKGLS
jgi:hypothetical protein